MGFSPISAKPCGVPEPLPADDPVGELDDAGESVAGRRLHEGLQTRTVAELHTDVEQEHFHREMADGGNRPAPPPISAARSMPSKSMTFEMRVQVAPLTGTPKR